MEVKGVGNGKVGKYLMSDILLCVGKNGLRYYGKFGHLNAKGHSFNWCAALFSAFWFAYRKMWKAAAAMLAANAVIFGLISALSFQLHFAGYVPKNFNFEWIPSLFFMAVSGFLGDWLYFGRIKDILDQHGCDKAGLERDEAWETSVKEAGGTSIKGIFLFWVIGLVVQFLIYKIL